MIITDRLAARAAVDARHIDNPDAFEAMAEKLGRDIIRTGEGVGAFIRQESIWVRRLPGISDCMTFDLEAIWSPDPAEGVQLRGGPNDGRVVTLRREEDGRPIDLVRIRMEATDPFMDDSRCPQVDPVASYERVGIDSERDVWVYEYRGQA